MSKYVSSPIALQLYFNSGENGVIAPTVVDGITRRKVDLPQCTIRKCIEFIGTYSNPNGKGSSFARGKRTIKKDLHHIDCTSHSIKTLFQAIFKYQARYKNQYGHYEIKYDVRASRYYSNYELQRVLSAATKSLFDYTEDILQREGNHIDSSGVFGGESSLVYSYSLLYQLTRNPEYLKYAEKHFPIIERAVQYDQAFDVVYGNAGAILALINLYSLKRDKRYLNCAKTAAKVICDAQQKGGGWKAATVSAPLAGFSHGVAGIVYALNKLYKLYPDKHIKQCIVNGLQYEDELFCEADGNWKDIRKGSTNGKNLCAWCHGAGGILLSRISLLGNIDNETDEIVKEDIRNAVKTMQSHKYLQNPCVCHGIAGNAEILLTYGQQFQDQIASSTAKHFYSRLVGSVNSGTFECSRPYLYGFNIPGFMTGLAGIGYSLLRLLDPTLPSVLQINI